jgi:hypothetical protein
VCPQPSQGTGRSGIPVDAHGGTKGCTTLNRPADIRCQVADPLRTRPVSECWRFAARRSRTPTDHHARQALGGLPPVMFELVKPLGEPDPSASKCIRDPGQGGWTATTRRMLQVLVPKDRSPQQRRVPVKATNEHDPNDAAIHDAAPRPHHQLSEPWPIVPSRISPDEVSGNSLCTGWSRTLPSMVTNGPLHFGTRS